MNIEQGNGFVFEVTGNIKSLDDYQKIKSCIERSNPKRGDTLRINIKDSLSMPSAVIGYLLKLIKKEGININLSVGDKRLAQLLDDLNLRSVFNISFN